MGWLLDRPLAMVTVIVGGAFFVLFLFAWALGFPDAPPATPTRVESTCAEQGRQDFTSFDDPAWKRYARECS